MEMEIIFPTIGKTKIAYEYDSWVLKVILKSQTDENTHENNLNMHFLLITFDNIRQTYVNAYNILHKTNVLV